MKPADRLFPLKVDDELYIGGMDLPFNPEMKFSFDVALGEPGIVEGESLLETLQRMAEVVDGLVVGFRSYLS